MTAGRPSPVPAKATPVQPALNRGRASLGTRLLAPLCVLGILGVLLGTWLSQRALASRMEEELVARARTVAGIVGEAQQQGAETRDRIVTALSKESRIRSIAVVSGNPPRVVSSAGEAANPGGGAPPALATKFLESARGSTASASLPANWAYNRKAAELSFVGLLPA